MNKTLLGAVSAYAVDVTNPQSGGAVSVSPTDGQGSSYIPQVNADGTMNINLPEEYKGKSTVALKEGDITPTGNNNTGGGSGDDDDDDDSGSIKKYLPFIIGGGLLLFFFMRKK
jgi:hypothetical protein